MPIGIYIRKLGSRIAIGSYRPKCVMLGCNNLAMKTHKRITSNTIQQGGWYCDKFCQKHHRKKYSMRIGSSKKTGCLSLKKLSSLPCELCGWHKARCDLHRIIHGSEGGKYFRENIKILCPNCHRLQHPEKYSLENHEGRDRCL